MKFLADHMVGRLAKWLRILGYDTLFLRDASDREILETAKLERRILLTRDRALANSIPRSKSLIIRSGRYGEQIEEVVNAFHLRMDTNKLFSICLECNAKVRKVPKARIRTLIADEVFNRHNTFWQCPKCEKVFWQGSHYENSLKKLLKLNIC